MNTARTLDQALSPATGGARVGDFMLYHLERALRARVRYRYVQPNVLREGDSFRIQSPCCSRNIDPSGGLIDIALLVPSASQRWCLFARDHASHRWVPRFKNQPLPELLDLLCLDSERQFWP